MNYPKLIVIILIAAYFTHLAATPETYRFLDSVDLVFHEAGHTLFMWGPEWLMYAGGSIMQTLIPLICVLAAWRQKQHFAAAILLFWLGQSFLSVSVYAADALTMKLTLIGGPGTEHDWNWLLWRFGALRHTDEIALFIRSVGTCLIVAAAAWGIWLSRKNEMDKAPLSPLDDNKSTKTID